MRAVFKYLLIVAGIHEYNVKVYGLTKNKIALLITNSESNVIESLYQIIRGIYRCGKL
jgi:hypothetical protein